MTVKELLSSVYDIQCECVVRQWDYEKEEYVVDDLIGNIGIDSPVMQVDIMYLYIDTIRTANHKNQHVLVIELQSVSEYFLGK